MLAYWQLSIGQVNPDSHTEHPHGPPSPHLALTPGQETHSLFDFFGGEVQVAIADPLNLKPVSKAIVATAFELNLQHVDGLLHETPARGICVSVVLHAILEPVGQGALQGAPHEEAAEGHQQEGNVEEDTDSQVWLQPGLPLGVLGRVQGVIADLARQRVEDTG